MPRIIAFIATILTFIALFFAGRMNYYSGHKKPYRPLSMFPFEMNIGRELKLVFYFKFILSMFIVANISFSIISLYEYHDLAEPLFLLFSLILSGFLILCLFMVDTRIYKIHVLFAILLMASNVLNFALIAIIAFTFPYYLPSLTLLKGGSIALAVICFSQFFIPKLKNWMRLEAKENEDHTISLIRPKYFILAILEWGNILAQIVALVIIFIFFG